jgi:hypothetical protein
MDTRKDKKLIETIKNQDGNHLSIQLKNGEIKSVWNIAWGYDIGDDYAHITTNISPTIKGTSIDIFCSYEIARIMKVENNSTIYEI